VCPLHNGFLKLPFLLCLWRVNQRHKQAQSSKPKKKKSKHKHKGICRRWEKKEKKKVRDSQANVSVALHYPPEVRKGGSGEGRQTGILSLFLSLSLCVCVCYFVYLVSLLPSLTLFFYSFFAAVSIFVDSSRQFR
jgi:hypothetical protein